MKKNTLVPIESIEQKILFIRGQKVMLDRDLAELYGVKTKILNQTVKRNIKRFPSDFMFQLEYQEVTASRSQIVTLKKGKNIKYRPYAFTENGVAMLSSVLNSERAVQVNMQIMRTFTKLRQIVAANKDLSRRLDELENKYDSQFRVVFDAIRKLVATPEPKHHRIGFI